MTPVNMSCRFYRNFTKVRASKCVWRKLNIHTGHLPGCHARTPSFLRAVLWPLGRGPEDRRSNVSKKINPCRRPATEQDVRKIYKQAQQEAVRHVFAIFFTVLHDKEGYGIRRMKRLWGEMTKLGEEIEEGRIDLTDLLKTLEDEMGVQLV